MYARMGVEHPEDRYAVEQQKALRAGSYKTDRTTLRHW
jgi:hypothetical protein